jgi:PilZ domain
MSAGEENARVTVPVRLKVSYKSPEALLGELTRSVGRGGVRIESKRAVPVGTQFIFELKSIGLRRPVEVHGTVMSISEASPGRWVLHIRYEPPRDREGLDAVLSRIFETAQADVKRRHARLPLQVRAVEDKPSSPVFRLRDISLGGVGIDVEADTLPEHILVGAPFLLQMKLTSGTLQLHGEVAWAVTWHEEGFTPRVGVVFAEADGATRVLLDDLLSLTAMPSPPWIARIAFGPQASRPSGLL